jgi:hypothetical protein
MDGPPPALGNRRRSFGMLRTATNNDNLGTLAEANEADEQMSDNSDSNSSVEGRWLQNN